MRHEYSHSACKHLYQMEAHRIHACVLLGSRSWSLENLGYLWDSDATAISVTSATGISTVPCKVPSHMKFWAMHAEFLLQTLCSPLWFYSKMQGFASLTLSKNFIKSLLLPKLWRSWGAKCLCKMLQAQCSEISTFLRNICVRHQRYSNLQQSKQALQSWGCVLQGGTNRWGEWKTECHGVQETQAKERKEMSWGNGFWSFQLGVRCLFTSGWSK